jgi:hypothetical protein
MFINTCVLRDRPYHEQCFLAPRARAEKEQAMRIHRARAFIVSLAFAATAILVSVATVLADGGAGPIPK